MQYLTARLLLRPPTEDDLAALRAIVADPVALRYRGRTEITEEMTREFLRQAALSEAMRPRLFYPFVVALRAEGGVIGECGLTLSASGEREPTLWYALNPAYWRRGYMSEAVWELLRMGFEELRVQAIVALCHPANRGSIGVLERVGMRQIALDAASEQPRATYRITEAEWRQLRSSSLG